MAAPAVSLLLHTRPFDYSTPRYGYSLVNLRLAGRTGGRLCVVSPPPSPPFPEPVTLPVLELDAEDCPPPPSPPRVEEPAAVPLLLHTRPFDYSTRHHDYTLINDRLAGRTDGVHPPTPPPKPLDFAEDDDSLRSLPLSFTRFALTTPTRPPAGLRPAKRSRVEPSTPTANDPRFHDGTIGTTRQVVVIPDGEDRLLSTPSTPTSNLLVSPQ